MVEAIPTKKPTFSVLLIAVRNEPISSTVEKNEAVSPASVE